MLIPDLDIAACSSTLGNLLRFVRGKDNEFRFLVEKVGNTIFFIRRENSPREKLSDVVGYGHTFPKAYTTWEENVKVSSTHQRLITYRFGGLQFLVRFEADGYLSEDDLPKASPTSVQDDSIADGEIVDTVLDIMLNALDFDDSDDGLDKLSGPGTLRGKPIPPPSIPESSTPPPPLNITSGSNPFAIVPQAQMFDLKTRSINARNKYLGLLEDELPRLWITQVPNFIVGFHTRGMFSLNDIEMRDVRPDVQQWEKERSKDKTLAKLAAMVRKLIDIVGVLDEQWNGEESEEGNSEVGGGDREFDSDEAENGDQAASGSDEDANVNQGKIKDDKKTAQNPCKKKDATTKGKSELEVSDRLDATGDAEKPKALKTHTPVRIEVVHRPENFGILEIRHQGWEETSDDKDKNKPGRDGRDGALSSAIRELWLIAQEGTCGNKRKKLYNPKDATSDYDMYSWNQPGRLLDPFYDSDISDFDYGYDDDSDDENRGGDIGDMLTFDVSEITPVEMDRLARESRLFGGGWSRGYGGGDDDDHGAEVLDFTACSSNHCGNCGRCDY